MIDTAANTKWNKSQISYFNYNKYISKKKDRFQLDLIDLLFIKNFKGGNATINEPTEKINKKLVAYSTILRRIEEDFEVKHLFKLNHDSLERLKSLIGDGVSLCSKKANTKIDGFSTSFLSALFNVYFPNLIPILDRRILINLHLVQKEDLDSQKQIKGIARFYAPLINHIYKFYINSNMTLREIDKELFTRKLSL